MAFTLRHSSGYEATFLPEFGMNLASFKKDGVEVIDQETKAQFDERRGGLGPLIGPHFHVRPPARIPKLPDESAFSEIANAKENNRPDPFSHGIARYAPWKVDFHEDRFIGTLSGKEKWNDIPLADIEGQNFTMTYEGFLSDNGLKLTLSVVSDTDSVVGWHTYFRLPSKMGTVTSRVQKKALINNTLVDIPTNWGFNENQDLRFELTQPADYTFFPFPNALKGVISLHTSEYTLNIHTHCQNQENSWQLWHPKDSSFVCIEPLSAANPRNPVLSASTIEATYKIDKH